MADIERDYRAVQTSFFIDEGEFVIGDKEFVVKKEYYNIAGGTPESDPRVQNQLKFQRERAESKELIEASRRLRSLLPFLPSLNPDSNIFPFEIRTVIREIEEIKKLLD